LILVKKYNLFNEGLKAFGKIEGGLDYLKKTKIYMGDFLAEKKEF
jgi:hypothetical protein